MQRNHVPPSANAPFSQPLPESVAGIVKELHVPMVVLNNTPTTDLPEIVVIVSSDRIPYALEGLYKVLKCLLYPDGC